MTAGAHEEELINVNRTSWVLVLTGMAATALVASTAVASTPPTSTPRDAPAGSEPGDAATADALGALDPTTVRLDARATLNADFLVDDIPTGALSDPANGRTPPYEGHIVPGFSGIVANDDGSFWAMPDNGFGTIENSADFLLRLYHMTPDWETASGGDRGDLRQRLHLAPRPEQRDRLSDRQRGHARAAAHR